MTASALFRHCERSEAIQSDIKQCSGLLRFARNDGGAGSPAFAGDDGKCEGKTYSKNSVDDDTMGLQ